MSEHFRIQRFASPIGTMLLLTDADDHVRGLDWEDCTERMNELLRLHYRSVRLEPLSTASPARLAMEAYFDGAPAAMDALRVRTGGTEFQRAIWAALRTIPLGETTTYARLASRVGRPKAIRAAGAANGANPISIIVPCHRVIGSDRSLTGYGGGLNRKRWLLEHERRLATSR